ncbi:primase-helicase family protein [Rudanella lutea]|uniref:primase-helicase family protein n=1 Tax=Rudanella lutea TaxID=451374 RepID=UPI001FE0F8AA|nr:primase-helicase family protein [Rudanella lutea]
MLIILHYYPQAEKASQSKRFKFKIREEATASCTLTEHNGVWWVKDFGSGEKAMSPIDVVMREERLDFAEAMKLIAERFEIAGEDGKSTKPAYTFSERPATPEEEEGHYYPEVKEFSVTDLKAIFSKQIWVFLSKRNLKDGEQAGDEVAMRNAKELCKQYHLYALASYTYIKNRKALTFGSTDTYPQFMFDEGTWQKYYKPKEKDKSRRFFSAGRKPERYLFGLMQAQERLNDLQGPTPDTAATGEDGEVVTTKAKRHDVKLPEIILCTGGSDALNVAALGYSVIWQNSETAELASDHYARIRGMAERVYNLPDIDETGRREAHKLATEYLDLHTIFLPDELRKRYDLRGNPCKDVRDFFTYYTGKDFDNLLRMAYPLRFWDEEPKRDRNGDLLIKGGRVLYEYKPNNELIYNFLHRNGFGLLELPNDKRGEILVRIDGNVVRPMEFSHINRFVKEFLKRRYSPIELLNAFHRSKNFSKDSMSNLSAVEVSFEDFGRDHQYLFFQNETWCVTKEGIKVYERDTCDRFVWEAEVLPHDVKVIDAPFTISKTELGDWDIQIHSTDCLFLRYLINASRVYWRPELEERLDERPRQEQEEYLEKYRWAIDGPLLTEEEIREQKQHLINKLISFGYLLHRYKDPAHAYCIWAMDYEITTADESHGGTGKSMAYTSLVRMMQTKLLGGRDTRLTENAHVLEGVSEHTDMILVDDANKYLDFQYFFSMITSFTTVNPKGMSSYSIPFEQSPKLCITSNFPPSDTDKSTMRRLWFTTFSDYYHKNPTGDYREERLPLSEFGKALFTDFNSAEWNCFMNVMGRSVQAWLTWGKVEPPMKNVMLNTYKAQMGPTFHAWADSYFRLDEQRLDHYVPRYMAQETYKPMQPGLSPQGFLQKLQAWCRFKGYTLNPVELQNADKRIMERHATYSNNRGEWTKTGKSETKEMLYIQTNADTQPERRFWDDDPGAVPVTPLPF